MEKVRKNHQTVTVYFNYCHLSCLSFISFCLQCFTLSVLSTVLCTSDVCNVLVDVALKHFKPFLLRRGALQFIANMHPQMPNIFMLMLSKPPHTDTHSVREWVPKKCTTTFISAACELKVKKNPQNTLSSLLFSYC